MNKDLLRKIVLALGGCILLGSVMWGVYKIGENKGQAESREVVEELLQDEETEIETAASEINSSESSGEANELVEEVVTPEFILGTSQNEEAIYDMTAYGKIKDICLMADTMRDEKGNSYEITLYSPDASVQVSEFRGAFAEEGEMVIEGQICVAIKKENSDYFREFIISQEPLALNISRELIRIIPNQFEEKRDFLVIGVPETSNDTYIRVYKVAEDKLVPMEFVRDTVVHEGSYTTGNDTPFFHQADATTYEIASYDNVETFKYYIETFTIEEGSDAFYGGNVYGMQIEDFKEYKVTGVKPIPTVPTPSPVPQAQATTPQYFHGNWVITDSYQSNGEIKMPLYMEGGQLTFDLTTNQLAIAINTQFMHLNVTSDISYTIDGARTINIYPTNPYGGEGFIYDTVTDSIVWIFGRDNVNNTVSLVILERQN